MSENQTRAGESQPKKRTSFAFSWATLGFLLGALFVLALPPRRVAAPPAPQPPPAPVVVKRTRPLITTIEAVFDEWGKYAVWHDDVTEVALYDDQTKSFSDCYQVLRTGGKDYFRSIADLRQVVLDHGVPENSPLEFTETAEQHDEWLKAVNDVNWKAIQKTIRTPGP
ncbi:MAG: hypothetical protein ACREFX_10125 [Opitutaceae bacterium]